MGVCLVDRSPFSFQCRGDRPLISNYLKAHTSPLSRIESVNTVKNLARSPNLTMADIGALLKLARTFDVSIE
ncbi:hypothetical protein QUB60_11425 [Microcoleus sp. A2-C5]|uniref:hypothetical protein n=1 Tax=unclassified Microcoleus TaxID=2642155 RepID=UPI002FD64843